MQVIERARERENEIGSRERVFGIAAIDGVSGECGGIAEILETTAAIGADAVDTAQPRNAHARRQFEICGAAIGNFADNLMSGDDIRQARRQFAFDNVQIRSADAAGAYSKKHVPRSHGGLGHFPNAKRVG